MARQRGIIKINGTLGDITFYKSKDGYMVREKGGVEASRMQTIRRSSAQGKTIRNSGGQARPESSCGIRSARSICNRQMQGCAAA